LTEKFSKWLPYIGFLFVLAILSITNEKVITSKERKIDNLKLEIEQLNREKAIEEANYFNRKDGKELTDKANKLGLKKNPSNIRGINKNEK